MTAINPLLHTHALFSITKTMSKTKDKQTDNAWALDTFHSITNHHQFIKQAHASFHFCIHDFETSKHVKANCKY